MREDTKALLANLDKLTAAIEENTEPVRGHWLYQMARDEVPAVNAGRLATRAKALVLPDGQAYRASRHYERVLAQTKNAKKGKE